jgi:hypothetical protein
MEKLIGLFLQKTMSIAPEKPFTVTLKGNGGFVLKLSK